jgi:Ser-tRNA(Ala) deacylase AlaX
MGITMPSERTIQGEVLECAGRTITTTYTLIVSSDHLGDPNATGLLLQADIAYVNDECLSESLVRLRLEDKQEITVLNTPRDDGSLLVQSSGAARTLDKVQHTASTK